MIVPTLRRGNAARNALRPIPSPTRSAVRHFYAQSMGTEPQ